MESFGIVSRKRSENDERKVIVHLTAKGRKMRKKATSIPEKLAAGLIAGGTTTEELIELRNNLNMIVDFLIEKNRAE
jgi:DNA-binding MarR family transcriptional regulator